MKRYLLNPYFILLAVVVMVVIVVASLARPQGPDDLLRLSEVAVSAPSPSSPISTILHTPTKTPSSYALTSTLTPTPIKSPTATITPTSTPTPTEFPTATITPVSSKEPEAILALLSEVDNMVTTLDNQIISAQYVQSGPFRRDYDLCPDGQVIITSFFKDGFYDLIQYDLNCDGNFQVAKYDVDHDGVFDLIVYDTDGNSRVDYGRFDVDLNGQFDESEVYLYDSSRQRWQAVTGGLSVSFRIFLGPIFPLPFFYP